MKIVVVDGVESEPFDSVEPWSLCFSADGKHAAYVVNEGRGQRVVVDGVRGEEYETILQQSGMKFGEDGTLNFVAARTLPGTKPESPKEREQELVGVTVRVVE